MLVAVVVEQLVRAVLADQVAAVLDQALLTQGTELLTPALVVVEQAEQRPRDFFMVAAMVGLA
jgi:hypothetical protein